MALLLSDQDVIKILSEEKVLQIVEDVYKATARGEVILPPKMSLNMRAYGIPSWINAMPSFISSLGAAGIKWVGGFEENRKKQLPYIVGTIILNDPKNGSVLSVMNGSFITNMRTGASAALAAKYLSRKNPEIATFIGAGVQARMTFRCLNAVLKLKEIRAVDINDTANQLFKKDMQHELGVEVAIMRDVKQAVNQADIIFTATQADEALVLNKWIQDGATAISLGSYQEFDESFVLAANKVIVDSWAQCKKRGELKKLVEQNLFSERHLYAEMSDIVAEKKPGRESSEERILAVLIGVGSHDIAIAHYVYQTARKQGLGMSFEF